MKSGFFQQWNNPLFYCFMLSVPLFLAAQNDSVQRIQLDAGIDYFDLFNQSSDRIRTKVFSTTNYIGGSYSHGADSVTVLYLAAKEYGTFRQENSLFSASATKIERSIRTNFFSRWKNFSYFVMVGYNIDASTDNLLFGAGTGVLLWEESISLAASIKKNNMQSGVHILFQDFLVPLTNSIPVMHLGLDLTVKPNDYFYGELTYLHGNAINESAESGYSFLYSYRSDDIAAMFRYQVNDKCHVKIFAGQSIALGNATFKKDKQSFGSLFDSRVDHNNLGAEFSSAAYFLPLRIRYSFHELFLSGSGVFESWPFTSLAASIISNRLNYIFSGSTKYHAIGISTDFKGFGTLITLDGEYNKILPDMSLEHWEPEFLVFGMKNYLRDRFTIQSAHLGRIKISLSRSFSSVTLYASLEQYLPLKIAYRQFEPVRLDPPITPVKTTRPSTDGGRRIAIHCSILL